MNIDPPIWDQIEKYAENNDECSAALLSLRARVEALEVDANRTSNPSQIRSSLLTAVSEAISAMADCGDTPSNWQPEARAAIYAVAEWLDTHGQHGCSLWLREEVQ